MEKIALTTELINAILQYLGTRSYVEVAGLIAEIQKQALPSQPQLEETSKES